MKYPYFFILLQENRNAEIQQTITCILTIAFIVRNLRTFLK